MGNNAAGEVAAKIAIDTFRELIKQPLPAHDVDKCELLMERFYAANTNIRQQAAQDINLSGMGTTIVAAIFIQNKLLHLYAGDCRLYHFRQGESPYVTADHSLVRMLLELGEISPEQVANHPMRSVVNSCLGGKGTTQFSINPKWDENPPVLRSLQENDVILLCSDGLHGLVSDPDLQTLVKQFGESPEELTEACINFANRQGGDDNITVIAIRVKNNSTPPELENRWKRIINKIREFFLNLTRLWQNKLNRPE